MGLCQQLAAYWPAAQQDTARAVCTAESGGRQDAQNCATGRECSLCAFQVNILAHPQYDGARLLSDPDYCARTAREIWDSQGWQGWGAYTAGTYRRYLGSAGEQPSDLVSADRSGLLALVLLAGAAFLLLEVL